MDSHLDLVVDPPAALERRLDYLEVAVTIQEAGEIGQRLVLIHTGELAGLVTKRCAYM